MGHLCLCCGTRTVFALWHQNFFFAVAPELYLWFVAPERIFALWHLNFVFAVVPELYLCFVAPELCLCSVAPELVSLLYGTRIVFALLHQNCFCSVAPEVFALWHQKFIIVLWQQNIDTLTPIFSTTILLTITTSFVECVDIWKKTSSKIIQSFHKLPCQFVSVKTRTNCI